MSDSYSRVYHRLMTEYPSVWKSDKQLALFLRLLVMAEKFYPEWPTPNRRNGAYQSLVKAGLVIEKRVADSDSEGIGPSASDSYVYTVRGLEAERERRSHAARNAAASRWEMPRRVETSKEEKISANGTDAPTSFIRYRPKEERVPGEAFLPRHNGQHDAACLVCHPVLKP